MTEKLMDWVGYHGRIRPEDPALTQAETGVVLTWGALADRVGRLAFVLRDELGIEAGDRVAVLAENDPRMIELQFACVRLGAILVPLSWRLTAQELIAQLADARVSTVVHDSDWSDLAEQLQQQASIRSRLGWGCPDPTRDYDAAITGATGFVEPGLLDLDAATQVMYTSGTTGDPKGVICTNRTWLAQAQNFAHTSRMAERGSHHLNMVPWFHAGGLNVFSLPILYWGGHVTTVRRFDASAVLALLTDPARRITHLCGVLQMYEWMVRLPEFDTVTFPALHTVLFGGWGPATQEVYEAFLRHGIHVQLSYGASELGPNVAVLSPADDAAARAGSSGQLLPHTEIRITDPAGVPVAAGEPGELWFRGPGVTPGYWGVPREVHFDGEWFRTGDVGRLDEQGQLFIVGRIKEMYRSGGENVYPAEVEDVLAGMPGIADLAVVGVPDEKWGEVGLLAVVPADGASITLAQVQEFARQRLARFKLPAHLLVMDELPRSATAKIARFQIRDLFVAGGPAAPGTGADLQAASKGLGK